MADTPRIIIKTLLDTSDIKKQIDSIEKDISVNLKINLNTGEIEKQINSLASKIQGSGKRFKINYGIDRESFVRQFRTAGEEAKKEIERTMSGAGKAITMPVSVDNRAIKQLEDRLNDLGLDERAIKKATDEIAKQNIHVSKISESFKELGSDQQKVANITIQGTDELGRQVNVIQRFDVGKKKQLQTETQIVAKLNEQGEIVSKMATDLRSRDIGTIQATRTHDLATFVAQIKNANLYTEEMQQETQRLGEILSKAFSEESMTGFLNQFEIVKARFKTLKEEAKEIARPSESKIDSRLSDLNTALGFDGMDAQTTGVTELRAAINSLIQEYSNLRASMQGLDPASTEFQNVASQVDALDTRFKSATQTAKIFNDTIGQKNKLEGVNTQIEQLKNRLTEFETKWSKFKQNPQLVAEFERLKKAVENVDAVNLQRVKKEVSAFGTTVRAAGADTRSLGDEFKNALAKFGLWISASTIFMQAVRTIRSMVQAVREIDEALVEFNKIANLSGEELAKFTERAFDAGRELGRTGVEVLNAAAIWKQAGYDIEDSLDLAKMSAMMQNVGDGITSVEQASSVLVAALKGFQMPASQAESVLDALNETANNNAIGFAALADGIQRTAGVMRQSGTTMQQTMGLLTGGYESLRNIEKVSTGLITISQRMRGVSEEGEAIDGLAPKLKASFKEIAGVDIEDQYGQLRSTYNILRDLAGAWDNLSSKQKQLIGEQAAGIRQISVFNAIIDNFKSVEKAAADATDSLGSARRENEIFLDSIQGKVNALTTAFQQLSQNTINSGLVKFFIDIATALVNIVDKIGVLPALLLGIANFTSLFGGTKTFGRIKALGSAISGIGDRILFMVKALIASKGNLAKFSRELVGAGIAASTAQIAFNSVVTVISILAIVISNHNRQIEEQSRKAKELAENWESTRETLAKTKETIGSIGPEFERLGRGVDAFGNNISLTSEEFNRYHEITNEIAGMFPELVAGYDSQGNAILKVKSNVEALNDAYKAQIALMNREIIRDAQTVFSDASEKYSGSGLALSSVKRRMQAAQQIRGGLLPKRSGFSITPETYDQIGKILIESGAEIPGLPSLADIYNGKGYYDISGMKPVDRNQLSKFIDSYIVVLEAERDSIASGLRSIVSAYLFNDKTYQEMGDQTRLMVDFIVNSIDSEFLLNQDNIPQMIDAVRSLIVTPLTDDSGFAKVVSDVSDAGVSFRDSKISIDEYAKSYANLQSEMRKSSIDDAVADAINRTIIDPKEYESRVNKVKGFLADEFDDMVGTLTLRELNIAAGLKIPDGVTMSWANLRFQINEVISTLSALTLTEQVESIKAAAETSNKAFGESAYYGSLSKAQYNELIKLGDDYAATVDNTNGYLTVNKEKLDALIASKQAETQAQIEQSKAAKLVEYAKNAKEISIYRQALELLTDEETVRYQQLSDLIDAHETSQKNIRDEIKAYDILASELNYATSAYKRWLDAKKAPEAGDAYDELSEARKALKEGLESGKIGTVKFKAAENLLIPEEVSAQGREAIKKYLQSLDKYLAEDGKGLNKFIDDLFKKGFLEKDATGTFHETAKANIKDIAKELNITEDAVRTMYLALKDYGWEIDIKSTQFDSTEAIAEVDKLRESLEEAEKRLAELRESGASKEQIDGAKKVVEQRAKQVADAEQKISAQTQQTLEEQLRSQIEAYQNAIYALETEIGVPAKLLTKPAEDLQIYQSELDRITSGKQLTVEASAKLDPVRLREEIEKLQNTTNEDGSPKSSIQLAVDAYLTQQYKATLSQIYKDLGITPEISVELEKESAESFERELNRIAEARTIILTAIANLDPKPLEEKIEELKSPTNKDGTPKTPIQLAVDAYLTQQYEETRLQIHNDFKKNPQITVEVDKPSVDQTKSELDDIEKQERTATIKVNADASEYDEKMQRILQGKVDISGLYESKELIEAYRHAGDENLLGGLSNMLQKVFGAGTTREEAMQIMDMVSNLRSFKMSFKPTPPLPQTQTTSEESEIPSLSEIAQQMTEEWEDTKPGGEGLPVKLVSEEPATVVEKVNDTLKDAKPLIEDEDTSIFKYGDPSTLPPVEQPVDLDTDPAKKSLQKLLSDIENTSGAIDVKVNYHGRDVPGYAKGTKKAKKGIALTGEHGIETVFDSDGFYTVGHDGPELVNLKGGEEILDVGDTKKLFRRRPKRASGQAFARPTSGSRDIVAIAHDFGEAVDRFSTVVDRSRGGTITTDKGDKSNKKTSKYKDEDLVDWIPTLLERLRKQTEKIIEQSENLVQYYAQNAKLDEAIKSNTDSINANNQAYERYIKQAQIVAKEGKLSADIVTKIQEGVIDIEAYDEKTRKIISNYQKWYDLAQDTLDTVSELRKEQIKLATQKLTNIEQYYSNRIGLYSDRVGLAGSAIELGKATGREILATDYDGIFSDLQAQLRTLREERKVYDETFQSLVKSGVIKQGSNEWFEYTANISKMDSAIIDASISLDDFNDIVANMPVENLNIAMKYLNTVQSTLESVQGLREAQGNALGQLDYEYLISVGMQQIDTLEAQNAKLKEQQRGLDVLSDAYQEIQDKIDDNLSSIWEIKTNQEGWNDAIIDLDIEKLQEVNDKYDRQLQTMEAIENLEKSRQRRNLIYREGEGFVYEADQGEIRKAQREYDDVMFDSLIDALESRKKDDNVYDRAGNLIGKQFTSLDGVDFSRYIGSVVAGREVTAHLGAAIGQVDLNAIRSAGAATNTVSFNGDIVLNGVNDVEGLANALRVELPSYISQLWFANN